MTKNQVVSNPIASYHLRRGINTIADLLAPTLGPIGGLVLNERNPNPEMLEDSATIVRRILSLDDYQKDVGAMLLRDLVLNVGQKVGDGGTMAALLARSLFVDALRLVVAGANLTSLIQGIDYAVTAVLTALASQSMQITSENDLALFALTITNDKPLAAVLGELSYMLGPDGYIDIQDYASPYLRRAYIAGACYPGKIASYHLYTHPSEKKAIVFDTLIALLDEPVQEAEDLIVLLQIAVGHCNKALAIIAPHFSDKAIGVIVANQKNLKDKCLLVAMKLDLSGDERQIALSDLAQMTGATLISSYQGKKISKIKKEDFGYARRVEVSEKTIVIECNSYSNPSVQETVKQLRRRLSNSKIEDKERNQIMKRLSTLTEGIGELHIGAATKYEANVRRLQAERALKVLACAQRSGVIPGGGAALIHCQRAVEGIMTKDDGVNLGIAVVYRSLPVIFRQLLHNAHIGMAGTIINQVIQAGPKSTYDILSRGVVDCRQTGILDSTEVVSTMVRMAASYATTALNTGVIVYHRKPIVQS
jgi:chaperonin GroEL